MSDAVPPALARVEAGQEVSAAKVSVTFVSNNMKTVTAPENSNLLRISLREQGGIPFKCGGGLCGTCKCRIEQGLEHTDAVKPKERRHLTEADLIAGYRMACQTFVRGDISVSWVPRDAAGGTSPARVAAGDTPSQA